MEASYCASLERGAGARKLTRQHPHLHSKRRAREVQENELGDPQLQCQSLRTHC